MRNDKTTGRQSGKRSWKIWLVICVLTFPLLVYGFFYAVHPLLTTFVFYPRADASLELYTSGDYLTFENGEDFSDFLSSCPFVEWGEEQGFFHLDTKIQDNPIHGKMPDFFSLDVRYSEEQYYKAKEEFLNTKEYSKQLSYRDYTLFAAEGTHGVYGIGFCDASQEIRYMLITEVDDCGVFFKLAIREWSFFAAEGQ